MWSTQADNPIAYEWSLQRVANDADAEVTVALQIEVKAVVN